MRGEGGKKEVGGRQRPEQGDEQGDEQGGEQGGEQGDEQGGEQGGEQGDGQGDGLRSDGKAHRNPFIILSGLIWLSTPVVNRSYGIPLRKSIVNQPLVGLREKEKVKAKREGDEE